MLGCGPPGAGIYKLFPDIYTVKKLKNIKNLLCFEDDKRLFKLGEDEYTVAVNFSIGLSSGY